MKSLLQFFLWLLLFNSTELNGQQSLGPIAGFGMPEYANIGLRGHFGNFHADAMVGKIPDLFSVTADIAIHFGGKSKHFPEPRWFFMAGFHYLTADRTKYSSKSAYISLRIGRDYAISKRFGIEFSLGGAGCIFYEKTEKVSQMDLFGRPTVVPVLRLELFYKMLPFKEK